MGWLLEYSEASQITDRFTGNPDQLRLLAAGLFGECGSILSELKKELREMEAYPRYKKKLQEEIGDFLWYFSRLNSLLAPDLLAEIERQNLSHVNLVLPGKLAGYMNLGTLVGEMVGKIGIGDGSTLKETLIQIWETLFSISSFSGIDLEEAAKINLKKTTSRWPLGREYHPLFDQDFPVEEQLPRTLEIEFRERNLGGKKAVVLRCNGLNFGDLLTDNIRDPDGYRFHDIFHFAHMVYLGWSPVVRSLLKCKRKSNPMIDEAQDGARAVIIEEGVSAIIYSRAKQLAYFDGISHIDYDLLKMVGDFVEGYEIDSVSLWQWEIAIQQGYSVFRELRRNAGGLVLMNLNDRSLRYNHI